MLMRIIAAAGLALAAPLVAASDAAAATGLGEVDLTEAAAAFLAGWLVLAVGLHLLTRRRRRSRGTFWSWEVQLDRKRSGRPWRDHAA